jgi:hypothetical protein
MATAGTLISSAANETAVIIRVIRSLLHARPRRALNAVVPQAFNR